MTSGDMLIKQVKELLDNEIEKKWEIIIPSQFDFALPFSEGLACVKIGTEYGYILHNGSFAIEPKYNEAWSFKEELAAVRINDKCGYINREGNIVYCY